MRYGARQPQHRIEQYSLLLSLDKNGGKRLNSALMHVFTGCQNREVLLKSVVGQMPVVFAMENDLDILLYLTQIRR